MSQYILLRGAKQVLTLRGPSGVRRGSALHDLGIIEDGSVLIRDGLIAAVGSSRRLENLKEARDALELSAHGCVVSPGFVDGGISLSLTGRSETSTPGKARKTSEFYNQSLELMRSCVQYGTLCAEIKASADGPDFRPDIAVLRQVAKFSRSPVAIVSSWRLERPLGADANWTDQFRGTLEVLKRRKLIQFIELEIGEEGGIGDDVIAAVHDLGVRINIAWRGGSTDLLQRVLSLSKPHTVSASCHLNEAEASVLANSQSILVLSSSTEPGGQSTRGFRQMVDSGAAVALSSGYDSRHSPGFSMEVALALSVVREELTPEEAFTAATINAAHAVGQADVTGTLEVGKRADILVLTVSDYREISREFGIGHVGMVIRDGIPVFNRTRWRVGV